MRFLFTTSSDISDGVLLAFDLKTREIRIADHRRHESRFEKSPLTTNDLFRNCSRKRIEKMVFADLEFNQETFDVLIRQLLELTDCDRIPLNDENKLAIEVAVNNYSVVIESNISFRTMTRCEFNNVLVGLLNEAQFRFFQRELRGR